MNDYTPTTKGIRLDARNGGCLPADFDAWLAEVERAAAEKAWDEGFDEAMDDLGASIENGMNPYRKEQ